MRMTPERCFSGLQGIIGNDAKAKALKKDLNTKKLMALGSKRDVVQRPFFAGAPGNKGYIWVHAFRSRILKDQNEIKSASAPKGAR